MKGIIFTLLQDLVEEGHGIGMWNDMLDDSGTEGVYTGGGSYPDQELFQLVGALSKRTDTSVEDLIFVFGKYALGRMSLLYPDFFEGKNVKTFLESVHDVIHVEVEKLYPDAKLPHITYEDPGLDQLVMMYRSERKLCRLGEGLIAGAADYFGVDVKLNHSRCLHKGDDHCRFELDLLNNG